MAIKLGSNNITKLYLGSVPLKSVYLGSVPLFLSNKTWDDLISEVKSISSPLYALPDLTFYCEYELWEKDTTDWIIIKFKNSQYDFCAIQDTMDGTYPSAYESDLSSNWYFLTTFSDLSDMMYGFDINKAYLIIRGNDWAEYRVYKEL